MSTTKEEKMGQDLETVAVTEQGIAVKGPTVGESVPATAVAAPAAPQGEIEKLLAEQRAAERKLGDAWDEKDKAYRRYVDALNVFNGVCNRLDKALKELREKAPRETRWAEERLRGERA